MSNKIIGIDLGTINSVVSVMDGSTYKIIPNREGQNTTPSIVAFTQSGEKLVGVSAKRQAVTNPKGTIYTIKRLMGHKFDDASVQRDIKNLSYNVVKADNGDAWVEVNGSKYSPQEISAAILTYMKEIAEDYLGEKVSKAVITVPAYFDDSQRQATKDAGQIAGLEVLRIINEPTASCLAYGLDKDKSGTIAVYDFGGGTMDVSVLEIGEGVFEVKSTNGDSHLGGADIDNIVMGYIIDEFKKETGIDLSKDNLALQRLKDAAESAKIELSSSLQTDVNLPFITADASGPKHLNVKITRAKFESLIDDIIKKTITCCKTCIKDSGVKIEEIQEVVLVGGSTRIPAVQKAVQDFFNREPNKSVNPDEVVGAGAAIQGGVLRGDVKDVVLLDIISISVGLETYGGIFTRMIDRNTTIPVKKTQIFSTASDNQPAVTIRIANGERELFADNKLLGQFDLVDIPPAPRGIPQIEILFDVDTNGILHVSAKDKATGKEQSIRISGNGGLTKEEIDRMIKDAEMNKEADELKKNAIETRNQADSLIANIKKTLSENEGKISDTLKEEIEYQIKAVEDNMQNENVSLLKTEFENLQKISMKIGEELYKKQQEAENIVTPNATVDNVVDAEFKAV